MFTTTIFHSLLGLAVPDAGPGLHFIDVGQGAALLLQGEAGERVLVDSGPAAGSDALLHALAEHGTNEVDLWIHTHFDADHIGGFSLAMTGLDRRRPSPDDPTVARLWDRGLAGPLPDSEAFALYLALAGTAREAPAPGSVYAVPGLRIEVLDLDPLPAAAPENDRGLALCVEVGGVRALLPGDLSAPRVELAAAACGVVDVLWLSHHGAANASSELAITLANPELTVISAGHDNDHCHPSPLALALLHGRQAWILDGAGVDPRGSCPALVDSLGAQHHLVGGDLWIDAELRSWLGISGGWVLS
ncbi:ComEC/Rec2-related protein [Enhygromyxa salina]|uniref:ComEC/Rec2-related protein n=1 Tax=Enhygromyxa salina TaxID=215803 RepID=A0A0C1ZUL9_9BACT|nr:MBL fold metallo-hydrolase [Enhygromyxa salina]KIG14728.1 ComEC/Rec2-related protein [Enhygromyxa salina]